MPYARSRIGNRLVRGRRCAIGAAITALLLVWSFGLSPAVAQSDAAETVFWQSVENSKDPTELEAYLKAYPNGKFSPLARIRLNRLKAGVQSGPAAAAASAPARSVADPKPIHECDRLAANPHDTDRVAEGVWLKSVEQAERALAACRLAISEQPDNPRLQYQLGRALEITRQLPASLEWVHKAAAQNYAMAVLSLGRVHNLGIGVKKNEGKALEYFRQSAQLGNLRAMHETGLLIMQMRLEKSYGEGIGWFKKAIALGVAESLTSLGECYSLGLGVPRDLRETEKLYLMAIHKDDLWAMYRLAQLYFDGNPKSDPGEAKRLLEMAAKASHVPSIVNLGQRHYSGTFGRPDYDQAIRLFRQAAELKSAVGPRYLGYMYMHGQGVATDLAEGARWLRLAADRGDAASMHHLARAYERGHGVPKDLAEAVKLYIKASDRGLHAATFSAAMAYRRGVGVPKDPAKFIALLKKSAEGGHAVAQSLYGWHLNDGSLVTRNPKEAVQWFTKAANQKDGLGLYYLARAHDRGEGDAPRDRRAAATRMIEAIKVSRREAIDNMQAGTGDFSADFWREFQKQLKDAGHYKGAVDGKFRPAVREAVDRLIAESRKRGITSDEDANRDLGLDAKDDFGNLN